MAGNSNSGRPPKPAVVHLINGNPSKKNAKALLDEVQNPAVPVSAPDKPDDLDATASEIWDGLIPDLLQLGLVTRLDGHTLAEYCKCLSRVKFFDRLIDEMNESSSNGMRGYFQTARTGYRNISEVLQARTLYQSRVDAIGKQFGFSPLARRGLRVETPQGELFPNEQKQIAEKYF